MPKLTRSALLEKLAQRPLSATVFLHGDEEYLREGAVREVVDLMVEAGTRDFNFDQVRGPDATPEQIGSMLATPPMMAEYRTLLIRDAQGLSPKVRETIEGWLEKPYPGVILIIAAAIPSGSKSKFYDTLRSKALSVEFPAVDPMDLPVWLTGYVQDRHGVEIDLDAARALGSAIGAHLGILAAELDKAVSYIGDRQRITLEDVKAVGGYIPRVDRWGWFDRIGERRFVVALDELPTLLDAGETGVGLVIGIGGHLLRLGLLVAGGKEALERHLKPHQRWLANRLYPQAKRWTQGQIDRALADLLRTDRLLKSASLTDRQAMEELLLRLAADEGADGRSRRRFAVGAGRG